MPKEELYTRPYVSVLCQASLGLRYDIKIKSKDTTSLAIRL